LDGGVLGRADDMMVIRGVNVFPSSVEQILRGFPEVIEYRMTARTSGTMDQLVVEIEDRLNDPNRVAQEFQLRLGLKVEVRTTPLGSLPRVEGKGKRFVDERCKPRDPAIFAATNFARDRRELRRNPSRRWRTDAGWRGYVQANLRFCRADGRNCQFCRCRDLPLLNKPPRRSRARRAGRTQRRAPLSRVSTRRPRRS
jgi:hypothetical protein